MACHFSAIIGLVMAQSEIAPGQLHVKTLSMTLYPLLRRPYRKAVIQSDPKVEKNGILLMEKYLTQLCDENQ